MIDITVALDKLSSFETANEIAQFFMDQNIKADMYDSHSCAISKWIQDVTGDTSIITNLTSIGRYQYRQGFIHETYSMIREHTEAMETFVHRFDNNEYPELVDTEKWADR